MGSMRGSIFVLFFVSLTRITAEEEGKGRVIELTDATFDAAIAKHDYIFVDFYAPWCFHCKKLSPELDVAAPVLAERLPPIVIAKLNADKYTKIASRFDVRGFPTLKFFIHGYPVDYKGPRKAGSLSSHLDKLASPEIKVLEAENELYDFLKSVDNTFPLFICFGVPTVVIADIAKEFKNKAWFLVLERFTVKTMENFDFDKSPTIVALRRDQGEQETFYGPFEGDDITLFVKQNLLPRVNLLTPESLRSLREDSRPIALGVLDDGQSEKSKSFIRQLKAAAPANRGFIFAYVDKHEWPSFVDSLNIDVKKGIPAFIVWDGDSTYFMSAENYDFGGENSESYITFFLQEYKEGKVKKLSMKGPSFTDFLWSLIGIRSVYILVVITAVIFLVQGKLNSDSSDFQKKQLEDEGHDNDHEPLRSGESHAAGESSYDSYNGPVKQD
ncbi:hypothetical protein KP509_02G094300 [Ceratopteris richardii]|uniref:Thioredoxin domain-containing protein n=1 Tax=Ceratopteris richardii TaxID=49495 RepID=A0A8T2VCR6_CERRI|nr:hypothetical protein KP509_02G094300 [Ceratopteris richardii]